MTKLVNASTQNCILRLKPKLHVVEENRCVGGVDWMPAMFSRHFATVATEYEMGGQHTASERRLDREWVACTAGGLCSEPDVKLELHYEAFTDENKDTP